MNDKAKATPKATRKPNARKRNDRGFCATSIGSTYSDDELDFMKAIDRYKRETGHAFPAWSEVLAVLISLGYRKVAIA